MCCMKYFTKSFLYYQQGHKSLKSFNFNTCVSNLCNSVKVTELAPILERAANLAYHL